MIDAAAWRAAVWSLHPLSVSRPCPPNIIDYYVTDIFKKSGDGSDLSLSYLLDIMS